MDKKLSKYNLDYCKQFSAAKLKKMYNGEDPKVIEALIKKIGVK